MSECHKTAYEAHGCDVPSMSKNGNVLILMTLFPPSLRLAHNSDSNSVVSGKIKQAFSGTSQSFSETQEILELFS